MLGVTPEKQKTFEEVKAEVKAGAVEADRRKEITALAAKLVERLAKGETLEALAKETGAKVEKTAAVTRNTSPPGLPQNAVQQAFALPKGGATSAPTADGKARIILRVADVIPAPPPTPEQTEPPQGRARAPAAVGCSGRVRRRPADALRPLRQRCGPEAGAGQRPRASSRSTSEPRAGQDPMTKLDVTTTHFEALPARSAFTERYRKGEPQVVWTRLVADLETPVSAALKLSDGQPMSCLLESVEGGAVRGRYSIIGIAPDVVWRAFGDKAEINRQPQTDSRRLRGREAADARNRCARCWRSRASSCRPTCRRSPPA